MQQADFSTVEQSNQVSEQLQLAVFESHGSAAQKFLYGLIIVMAGFTVWAAFAESDVCAESSGKLEPKTRVQFIKPSSDGTIQHYFVSEGQQVKKGDPLVQLNTIRSQADLTKGQQELSILEIELKEHLNARDGLLKVIANPRFNGKQTLALPEADRVAGELFASKKSLDSAVYDMSTNTSEAQQRMSPSMAVLTAQKHSLEAAKRSRDISVNAKSTERVSEKKKLEAKVTQLKAALDKGQAQEKELEAGLADAKKEMEIYEKGEKLGVASEVKFLEVQNYMHQREYYVAQQKLQNAQLEQDLNSAILNLEATAMAFNADKADLVAGVKAADERISSVPLSMNETVRSLQTKQAAYDVATYHARAQLSKELTEIANLERKIGERKIATSVMQQLLDERTMRAPVDGTVANLVHLMPGEMVVRGQPLLTIVPSDRDLVLRAEINSTDVGFVEVGQEARLRISAFPCEEFGIVHGTVVRVGDYPEQIVDQKEKKKRTAYRVTIQPARAWMGTAGKQFALQPGLEVKADVVLRKRSLLALLYEPLLKMGNQ